MPSTPVIIAPSLLAAHMGNIESEIKSVVNGGADWLHLDVMDGQFVPPISFGDIIIATAKKACSIPLDVHLMIREPEKQIAAMRKAGADRITVHQETCPHLHRTLSAIKAEGAKAGVAINPGTPVETIFDVLPIADLILVMTVNPGFGGQSFISSCLDKVRKLSQELKSRGCTTLIEVDGGINSATAKECIAAGASVLVAGTSVFGAPDRKAAIEALRGKR